MIQAQLASSTAVIHPLSLHGRSSTTTFSIPGFIGLYFGLRVCLTYLFFQSDPQAGAAISFALNILLLIPVAFYSAIPTSFTFRKASRTLPVRLVLAFLLLSLISLTWSETSSRIIAFGYWTAMAADVTLILLLMRTSPANQVCESLLKGFVSGVSLLSVIAWLAPTNSDLRLGNDEFLNPNAIGFQCALAILPCSHPVLRWL